MLNSSHKAKRDLLTKMSSIRNTDGVVTAHERYLYRDYLQIASLDMMEGQNQALINAYVWDPTQPVATRPLAIFYKGVAYYYGWDLTKNITEIFSLSARLQIDYVYTPFGQVRENGIIPQSIQWSSEYHDVETGLVYYNYRYYNPTDGRWTRRDPVGGVGTTKNLYWAWVGPMYIDILGLESLLNKGKNKLIEKGVGKLCKEVGEGKETGEVSKEVADIVKKGGTKTGKGTSNSSNKEDTGTRVEVTASVKIQEKEAAIRLKARADTHGNSSASASPSLHRNSQLSKREGRIGVSYYNGSSEVNVELFISKRDGEKIEAGISVGLKKSWLCPTTVLIFDPALVQLRDVCQGDIHGENASAGASHHDGSMLHAPSGCPQPSRHSLHLPSGQ